MKDLVRDGMLVGTLTGTTDRRARHDDERDVTVPDGDRVRVPMMCMDSSAIADAAYDAYVQRLSDAWKAPPSKPIATVEREAPATDPQPAAWSRPAVADRSAQDAAYERMCEQLSNAYKSPNP